MTKKLTISEYTDFSTGVHTESSQFSDSSPQSPFYGMKAAQEARNVEMKPRGLEKFKGFSAALETPLSGKIQGILEYKSDTEQQQLICAGGTIYLRTGASTTLLISGLSATAVFSGTMWAKANGTHILIICNGVDPVMEYDGSSISTVVFTDPDSVWNDERPLKATVWRGRVLYWGGPNRPDTFYTPKPPTSSEDGYDNFDTSTNEVDAVDIDRGLGGNITGIEPLTQDICIIYKDDIIRALSGVNPFGAIVEPFRIETVTDEIGCTAPHSIVKIKNDHYFWSENGYRQLSRVIQGGDLEPFQPTAPIKDLIETVNFSSEASIKGIQAAYVKKDNKIYLAIPTGSSTTNNEIIAYDTLTGANEPRGSGISGADLAVYNRQLYHGDYDGQVYVHGVSDSYDGEAIESYWLSKFITPGALKQKKWFRNLMIYFDTSGTSTITVQWRVMDMDGNIVSHSKSSVNPGGETWDTAVFDTSQFDQGQSVIFQQNNLGKGRAIQLKISNNNANEQWKVQKIEIGYQNLGKVSR